MCRLGSKPLSALTQPGGGLVPGTLPPFVGCCAGRRVCGWWMGAIGMEGQLSSLGCRGNECEKPFGETNC